MPIFRLSCISHLSAVNNQSWLQWFAFAAFACISCVGYSSLGHKVYVPTLDWHLCSPEGYVAISVLVIAYLNAPLVFTSSNSIRMTELLPWFSPAVHEASQSQINLCAMSRTLHICYIWANFGLLLKTQRLVISLQCPQHCIWMSVLVHISCPYLTALPYRSLATALSHRSLAAQSILDSVVP